MNHRIGTGGTDWLRNKAGSRDIGLWHSKVERRRSNVLGGMHFSRETEDLLRRGDTHSVGAAVSVMGEAGTVPSAGRQRENGRPGSAMKVEAEGRSEPA